MAVVSLSIYTALVVLLIQFTWFFAALIHCIEFIIIIHIVEVDGLSTL